jgi:REP element-mobilizing transposase RayT
MMMKKNKNLLIMANTFTQIYIQIVFSVRNRLKLIDPLWEDELYRYISGLIKQKGEKCLSVNGMPDHIHIFIGMSPDCILSDLVREIKKSTNRFIKTKGLIKGPFYWQVGYGAFSYSHSQLDRVIKYILNQKKHHRVLSFEEEYKDLLEKYEVKYNSKYYLG